jgi:hypothetical protein
MVDFLHDEFALQEHLLFFDESFVVALLDLFSGVYELFCVFAGPAIQDVTF